MNRDSSTPRALSIAAPVNLLPGPVMLHESVRHAFAQPAISHRSAEFSRMMGEVRRDLLALTGAANVQVLTGSGTMANDVIAVQLSRRAGTGLIISNGEFGERLCDAASRCSLQFQALCFGWGEPFDLHRVEEALRGGAVSWIWAAHCETSTGMLNPVEELRALGQSYGAELCLDCISSIGTLELDLSEVLFASASSGKALGSPSGLGVVFHRDTVTPRSDVPRVLDLGLYAEGESVPFTHSSNLIAALRAALKRALNPERPRQNAAHVSWLRGELSAAGFHIVSPAEHAAPGILTVALPVELPSQPLGRALERAGYWLAYESRYLMERNWMQICCMGEYQPEQICALPGVLRRCLHDSASLRNGKRKPP